MRTAYRDNRALEYLERKHSTQVEGSLAWDLKSHKLVLTKYMNVLQVKFLVADLNLRKIRFKFSVIL
jgi:hypothetical protein